MATSNSALMPLSTLTSQEKPAKVVIPPPATGAEGLAGSIESMQDSFLTDLTEKRKSAEKSNDQAYDLLFKNLLSGKGEAQLTDEAYKKDVDPLEGELKKINNDILAEQVGLRRRIEKLDKNAEGLFGGALEGEKERVTRESLAKQADMSVIQMGIQGRFDSAKAIADRAIAVRLEKDKMRNEILKFNYEENKDLFTKAEQREFETKQGDRERLLQRKEDDLKTISDLSLSALESGAPPSVVAQMRAAKTPEEAIQLGGGYVGSLDRQLKVAQIAAANRSNRGDSGGGTESEREATKLSLFSTAFESGRPMADGTPIKDTNGFITPKAWKAAIADATGRGIGRDKFISTFGNQLFTSGDTVPSSYGLTPKEQELIFGS